MTWPWVPWTRGCGPRSHPATRRPIAGGAQSRRRTDRFDKFTKRSRGALQFANEEAGRLGHDFIGTEHLLLGLLHESDGVAAGVLSNMGLDSPKVRAAILAAISRPAIPAQAVARAG